MGDDGRGGVDRDALLAELAELIRDVGAEPLLARTFFPVRAGPGRAGDRTLLAVARAIQQARAWFGLEGHAFDLLDARRGGASQEDDPPDIQLTSFDGDVLEFTVACVAAPCVTLANIVVELGGVFVAMRRLGPYRVGVVSATRTVADDRLAPAAGVLVGFGLVLLHAAHVLQRTWTRGVHYDLGGLGSSELAFLVAAVMVARDLPRPEIEAMCAMVDADARASLLGFVDELAADRPALLAALRLPPSATRAAPQTPEVPPISASAAEELARIEERYAKPNLGRETPRVVERRTGLWALLGGLIGVIPVVALHVWGGPIWPPLVALTIGGVLGSRRKVYTCGSCERPLRPETTVCPHCGANLATLITRAEHLRKKQEE